jgi:hypothetical protein
LKWQNEFDEKPASTPFNLGEWICHELAPSRRMSIMFCGQKSLLMGPATQPLKV